MEEIVVSSAPFMHSKNDVNRLFLYISLALIFPSIFGILLFGINAFFMIITSVLSCLAFEILYNYFVSRKVFVKDLSFLVTGLIFALTLPVKTPIYVIIFCSFFATIVVKLSCGGLGRNSFNPAVCARCLAGLMVPNMTETLYKLTIAGDEYVSIVSGGTNTISNLLSGQAVGGLGTTCVAMLLVIFIILSYMKIIDAKIPIFSIISYLVVAVLISNFESAVINICSGSFIFVCVFMLTDPVTSPSTTIGKLIYSIAVGVLSALAWNFGFLGENCVFVIVMVIDLFVPLLNKILTIKPTSIGGFRNAHKD